jgi:hypothetical protein
VVAPRAISFVADDLHLWPGTEGLERSASIRIGVGVGVRREER